MGVAQLPGNRDAMMAVVDEVDIAHLIKFNGRHAGQVVHRHLHTGPACLVAVVPGQKISGEIIITADTADNGIQGNLLQAAGDDAAGPDFLAHIFIGKKLG